MANVKISDLAQATLPIDISTTFVEVQAVEAGVDVSRKISVSDLSAGFGLSATFVTISANASLPNERVLTAGSDIGVTDNGAGSTVVIDYTGNFASQSDVNLTGAADNDMLYRSGGSWIDTAGKLTYDGATFSVVDPGSADTFSITPDGTDVLLDVGAHSGLNIDGGSIMRIRDFSQVNLRDGAIFVLLDSANTNSVQHSIDATPDYLISPSTNFEQIQLNFSGVGTNEGLYVNRPIWIGEQSAASDDTAARGQIWVRDDVPNVLMFTDDAGSDFNISGGLLPTPTVSNSVLRSDGSNFIESTQFRFEDDGLLPDASTGAVLRLFHPDGFALWFDDSDSVNTMQIYYDVSDAIVNFVTTASVWQFNSNIHCSNEVRFNDFDADTYARCMAFGGSVGHGIEVGADGDHLNFRVLETDRGVTIDSSSTPTSLYIEEIAAALSDRANYGQIWVRSDTPNVLMFTDDAGTDFEISTSLIPASTLASAALRADGSGGWEEQTTFLIEGGANAEVWVNNVADIITGVNDTTVPFAVGNKTSGNAFMSFDSANIQVQNASAGATMSLNPHGGSVSIGDPSSPSASDVAFLYGIRAQIGSGDLRIVEASAAPGSNLATLGQLWVRDDAPNTMMFTDDAGNDFVLSKTQVQATTADQGVTSSTTLVNITGLTGFLIKPGTRYKGKLTVPYDQDGGDIKVSLNYSQTANDNGHREFRAIDASAVQAAGFSAAFGTDAVVTTMTDGQNAVVVVEFAFDSHATLEGTLDAQFAQNTSDVDATTVQYPAWMEVTECE